MGRVRADDRRRLRLGSGLIPILTSALAGAFVSNLLLGELLATFSTFMALELTGALDQSDPQTALDG